MVAQMLVASRAGAQWTWQPSMRVATARPRGDDRPFLRNGHEVSLGIVARRANGPWGFGAGTGRTRFRGAEVAVPGGGAFRNPDIQWDWWTLGTELATRSRRVTPVARLDVGWGSKKLNGGGRGDLPLVGAGLGLRAYAGYVRIDLDANQKAFLDLVDGAQTMRSFGVAVGLRW